MGIPRHLYQCLSIVMAMPYSVRWNKLVQPVTPDVPIAFIYMLILKTNLYVYQEINPNDNFYSNKKCKNC